MNQMMTQYSTRRLYSGLSDLTASFTDTALATQRVPYRGAVANEIHYAIQNVGGSATPAASTISTCPHAIETAIVANGFCAYHAGREHREHVVRLCALGQHAVYARTAV